MIVAVGLSHKTAPISIRERIAIPANRLPAFLSELHAQPEIGEAFVVSTCNRVEVYATAALRNDTSGARTASAIERLLSQQAGPDLSSSLHQHLFHYVGGAAVRHLFRVASSLDSLVVGEAQVLGQVKDAFDLAVEQGTLGPLLSRAAESALHVAKRVRTETHVGAGSVSVSSVAVELARQIFGSLQRRTAVLVGAGTMGENAAKHLGDAGARIVVVNRSPQRAEVVAAKFDGVPRAWDQLETSLAEADVAIASTGSSQYVITRESVAKLQRKRRGRSLFIIDISVPRNVDPGVNKVDGVYLYDIDDLSKIANETIRERFREAQLSERIVAEEAEAFDAWLESLQVTPAIVAFRSRVREVLEAELDRSLHGKLKHLSARDRKALEGMLGAAVKKLTHQPTIRLKAAAAEGNAGALMEALHHLFALDAPENHTHGTGTDDNRPSLPPSDPPSSDPPAEDTRVAQPDRREPHSEEAR